MAKTEYHIAIHHKHRCRKCRNLIFISSRPLWGPCRATAHHCNHYRLGWGGWSIPKTRRLGPSTLHVVGPTLSVRGFPLQQEKMEALGMMVEAGDRERATKEEARGGGSGQ